MQLDALTAGVALVVVQLCAALIMAGIFKTAPREQCTHLWAWSGVSLAAGILLSVLFGGGSNFAGLLLSNTAIVGGVVLHWCAFRAFYRMPPTRAGWFLIGAFFLCFLTLLLIGASVHHRALLTSIALVLVVLLAFRTVFKGQAGQHSFASLMVITAFTLTTAVFTFRLSALIFGFATILPKENNLVSVLVLYIVPIGATLLLASGSLLLYFERVVADKHHLATHDELTGTLNRRAIVAGGEREVALAARLRQPLAIAYVDIDHFKEINDTYGHEAGDQVLRDVAAILKKTCRGIDLVGRYGGDEFCIVFPGTDREGIASLGDRLVKAVQQHCFRHGKAVTVSVGMAAISHVSSAASWTSLIQLADNALYAAKAGGRDRLCVAAAVSSA